MKQLICAVVILILLSLSALAEDSLLTISGSWTCNKVSDTCYFKLQVKYVDYHSEEATDIKFNLMRQTELAKNIKGYRFHKSYIIDNKRIINNQKE